ncbi:MAG TPA: VOC family protein [Candidatus Binatia bacterium]|nr:VOC family protein [Candidatus Binatia bacterium]
MIKGIDHIVIVVNDLDEAARDYEALGFTVVPGGKHPVGSHNALVAFADGSYIEIIAFYREAADHRWWEPLRKGERLVDYCLQTDDLRGDTKTLREGGVDIHDPVPWARTRPDGYELKWLLSLASGDDRGVAPFLIEDITSRAERIPQTFNHANGAMGINTVTVAIRDLARLRRWTTGLLGDGKAIDSNSLRATGLRYRIGPHSLDFLMPLDSQSLLAEWMRAYGPSPFAASLRAPAAITLDPNLTHGANLIPYL